MILSGIEVSGTVKTAIAQKTDRFSERFGRRPSLAVVLAGSDPASLTYIRSKQKACEEVGIEHRDYCFDCGATEQKILAAVDSLNRDSSVDGILVQLPLPGGIDSFAVTESIDPSKDVDGFTSRNIGRLLLGRPGLVACTPKGIVRLLDYYGIDTRSKEVCIIGRSSIVGKPLAALLMQRDRNATVTVCNSLTEDLTGKTGRADIVISAAGRPGLVTPDMIKEGAVVVDVGINRVPDASRKKGFRLAGDVQYNGCLQKAGAITPVPGGVGPMTIAMLMENTVIAACMHQGVDFSQL